MEVKKFYDNCVTVYPLVDLFLKPQKKVLVEFINSLPKGNLLDVGIGTGSHIPQYRNHEIQGIDVSDKSIQVAKKREKYTNVDLKVMNGEKLEFEDNLFDYVVLCHVIAVTENPDRMIEESYRVLKEDGLLFILNHETPDNGMKYLDKFFNRFSHHFKLSSYFKIKDIKSLDRFEVVDERKVGAFDYFKLLTLKKEPEKQMQEVSHEKVAD